MRAFIFYFLINFLFILANCQSTNVASEEKVKYNIQESKLEISDKNEIKPDSVYPFYGQIYKYENEILIANQFSISSLNIKDLTKKWEIKFIPGNVASIGQIENGILFCQAYQAGYPNYTLVKNNEIIRYKISNAELLKPFILESFDNQKILYMTSKYNYTAVLGCELANSQSFHERIISKYSISLFENDTGKFIWQKVYNSEKIKPSVGIKLFYNNEDPLYTKTSLNMINLLENEIIICAGYTEDVICLNLIDGNEKWILKNIWEFKRGFIGPSVWSYFISRFGIEDIDWRYLKSNKTDDYTIKRKKETEDKITLAKEEFKNSKIIGGPIVVKIKDKDKKSFSRNANQGYRIFMAVSKGNKQYGAYLSECIVYEISKGGEPISMVNMPYMVIGSKGDYSDNGFIWKISKNGFAKLVPSNNNNAIGFFSGKNGQDCISNLEWYCHKSNNFNLETKFENAWLIWSGKYSINNLNSNTILANYKGGFIETETSKTINLSFYQSTLPAGDTNDFTLKIPFTGKLLPPTSNFSNIYNDDDENKLKQIKSEVPLFISIQDIFQIEEKMYIIIKCDNQDQFLLSFSNFDKKNYLD